MSHTLLAGFEFAPSLLKEFAQRFFRGHFAVFPDETRRLASVRAVLRADLFDGDADRDAPFGEGLFADLVPARRLAADLAMPVEHDIHGLRMGE